MLFQCFDGVSEDGIKTMLKVSNSLVKKSNPQTLVQEVSGLVLNNLLMNLG